MTGGGAGRLVRAGCPEVGADGGTEVGAGGDEAGGGTTG